MFFLFLRFYVVGVKSRALAIEQKGWGIDQCPGDVLSAIEPFVALLLGAKINRSLVGRELRVLKQGLGGPGNCILQGLELGIKRPWLLGVGQRGLQIL